MSLPPGTAPVKPEYLLSISAPANPAPDDDAAEGGIHRPSGGDSRDTRSNGPSRSKKLSKEEKKAQRGSNKGRRFGKIRDEVDLCRKLAIGEVCDYGEECRQPHDVKAYLDAKPQDVRIPLESELSESSPFVNAEVEMTDAEPPRATICPIFEERGECRFGLKCRFLSAHADFNSDGTVTLRKNEEKKASAAISAEESNFVSGESLRLLRTRKYPTPIANAYLKEIDPNANQNKQSAPAKSTAPAVVMAEPEQDGEGGVFIEPEQPDNEEPTPAHVETITQRTGGAPNGGDVDAPDAQYRLPEKKRLDWKGKTYLAPLTTVGNLPFRRLCVAYGADITCGEMGLATSFLQGSKEEWSLVRRHPSEKIFGVQLCGNKPASLVTAAEAIGQECAGNLDFVDVNCGCPIDLVFNSGSGSALLDSAGKLGKIVLGMNKALGNVPVTVKLRTGIKEGKNMAHKLMPRLVSEFGASCLTLHGRTRQQRYTKLADWDYIRQAVEAVRAREADLDLPQIPIFGGGDAFSSEDYWQKVDATGVDGVMIGRGALIKPWIFTEVKERREWDISARERLDIIKQYAEFGISHFGSDTAGITTTRRYLCEALSFQYRYVPIGLLETLPCKLNDRAPLFKGRNDLETLLASGDSRDWVKLSEMFLGPAPEHWSFTPKHKSNAYSEQNQG